MSQEAQSSTRAGKTIGVIAGIVLALVGVCILAAIIIAVLTWGWFSIG